MRSNRIHSFYLKPLFILSMGLFVLIGCSPVKVGDSNQYQLSSFSNKPSVSKPRHLTLRVTPPEAVAGYQSSQMLYVKKPFQVEAFAKNTWASSPADMLFPLIVQSLQKTQFFQAVTSSSYTEEVDYRLDTQVLALKQNFLKKPSVLEFSAKVMLTNTDSNQLIASKIINVQIPCPADTPYGGVIAANRAVLQFTAIVDDFVISHVKHE